MKQIATALVKAQREFGPALKTSTNPHFRSRYADLSACVEAVVDALNNNGIFLLQKNHKCDDGVMVETVFVHESGEMMECGIVHFPSVKHDPQKANQSLMQDHLTSIQEASDVEELQSRFKEAFKACGNDKEWLEAITGAKDLMKRKLK